MTLVLSASIMSCSNSNEDATSNQTVIEHTDYQCPMKCEGDKVYPKERSCPICNMDLVEVAQG